MSIASNHSISHLGALHSFISSHDHISISSLVCLLHRYESHSLTWPVLASHARLSNLVTDTLLCTHSFLCDYFSTQWLSWISPLAFFPLQNTDLFFYLLFVLILVPLFVDFFFLFYFSTTLLTFFPTLLFLLCHLSYRIHTILGAMPLMQILCFSSGSAVRCSFINILLLVLIVNYACCPRVLYDSSI